MKKEFEHCLFIPQTKQLIYIEEEQEALKIQEITFQAQLYCWLIYIKK